ncbi:hypothetical protein SERLA73DRAFT_175694, partial [Serpula lacrymans var. lacrymans S7.3]
LGFTFPEETRAPTRTKDGRLHSTDISSYAKGTRLMNPGGLAMCVRPFTQRTRAKHFAAIIPDRINDMRMRIPIDQRPGGITATYLQVIPMGMKGYTTSAH